MSKEEITRENFEDYVALSNGLTVDECQTIMKNYTELKERYKEKG